MALKQYQVLSEKVVGEPEDKLANYSYKSCSFCQKMVRLGSDNAQSCMRLSRKRFYCSFCLRNDFQFRSSRNVLIFSYRSIIGYYYIKHYIKKMGATIWLNQIEDMIEIHRKIGLRNPVFSYDPSTYLWFADFNKIGSASYKAPFEEVLVSAKWIMSAFQLSQVLTMQNEESMWDRYEEAFKVFYKSRQRPAGKKMLIPTLKGIGYGQDEFFDETREFTASQLNFKS